MAKKRAITRISVEVLADLDDSDKQRVLTFLGEKHIFKAIKKILASIPGVSAHDFEVDIGYEDNHPPH